MATPGGEGLCYTTRVGEARNGSPTRLRREGCSARRGSEVAQIRWGDVDLDASWWTIPGIDTKNGEPHRVPLVKDKFSFPLWRFDVERQRDDARAWALRDQSDGRSPNRWFRSAIGIPRTTGCGWLAT